MKSRIFGTHLLAGSAAILLAAASPAPPLQALQDACRFADAEAVRNLLANFTGNINEAPSSVSKRTALHWALLAPSARQKEKNEVVEALLAAGADPNARSAQDGTPLMCALSGGWSPALLEALLEHGADPNLPGSDRAGALALAANLRDLDAVKFLLAHGAVVDDQILRFTISGKLPWPSGDIPQRRNHALAVVQALLEALDKQQGQPYPGDAFLRTAIATDDPKLIALIASRSTDIAATDAKGQNVLHYAARQCRACSIQTVKMLQNFGASLDALDLDGNTPLHLAVASQNSRAVEAFILAGADAQIKDRQGRIPAEVPGWAGLDKSVQKLLKTYSRPEPREAPTTPEPTPGDSENRIKVI